MPTKKLPPVAPGVFATYRGLTIFHCHSHGRDQLPEHYFYQLFPENDPVKGQPWLFDIRDLPNPNQYPTMKSLSHAYLLREAVDGKGLPDKTWLEEVGWKFRLKDTK